MRLLLLEDDEELGTWISQSLNKSGHVVDWFKDGRHALAALTTEDYDVVVLDRMTPGLDGLSVLKAIRAAKISTPVLFLSALSDIEDRVEGLEAGSDDYLSKPFALTELLARVNALGRRQLTESPQAEAQLTYRDLTLHLHSRKCTRQGQVIELNNKEFLILELFLRHPSRVLTKQMLLEKVWDLRFDPTTSVVETHLSRLRRKIEKPFGDTLIRTMRGAGYVLETG